MTSTLSTHVLDLTHGTPANGLAVRLLQGEAVLFSGLTNADGRCPDIEPVAPGTYRIEFSVAAYFRDKGIELPEPPFLDVVGIDFGIADTGGHYHVPLLVSPFGYSTYRGS
jgi:5-hydroxyisourate hydrolase